MPSPSAPKPKKHKRRVRPVKNPGPDYHQLWRIIDGAVYDAFKAHPEYLEHGREKDARQSIVKRVTGAILGYAAQAVEGRSGLGRRLTSGRSVDGCARASD